MQLNTMSESDLPRYDRARSYEWNYDHAPDPVDIEIPAVPGDWTFCGKRVRSPLGIPAGPLLGGRWVLYYASLGFDVLTYKTVRSGSRECYPLPNLAPVRCGQLTGEEVELPAEPQMSGSWAVSFGMPSKSPDVWRADVEHTREKLPPGKLLSVSVVGTIQPGWSLDQLADDYAQCARWAAESGADVVETNFSCPNVATRDGQLYQEPRAAGLVAARVRDAIGRVPLIIKIGHLTDRAAAEELLDAVADHVTAIAMTNSVAAAVRGPDGALLFDGQRRGICGDAIRQASHEQVKMLSTVAAARAPHVRLIGVGGASTAEHVRAYLSAGAEAVHLATSAMVDPGVGLAIRRAMSDHAQS